MKTYIYSTAVETARALIKHIISLMEAEPQKIFHIAFSGGSTPSLIYWVDERCVPAEDSESNYGTMRRLLLDKVHMPEEYIFPIDGNNRPDNEAKRYSSVVRCHASLWHGFPALDIVLLGAGEDGHTSSIFPGQEHLLSSFHPYEVSVNPYNGQKRIAMTGCLLFNAKQLIFFVTGRNKANVVQDILDSGDTGPAAYVAHHAWNVEVFMDELAKP